MSGVESAKHVVETGAPIVAVGTIAGWLAGVLPTIAAALSIVWLLMQIIMKWSEFKAAVKKLFFRNKGDRN